MPGPNIYQLRARWMEKYGKSLQDAEKLDKTQLQAELKVQTENKESDQKPKSPTSFSQVKPKPKAKRPIVNLKRLQAACKAKISECTDEMVLLSLLKSFDN